MIFNVIMSQKHILDGVMYSDQRCPVALALQESTGLPFEVRQGGETIDSFYGFLPNPNGAGQIFILPEGVGKWVRDYDTGMWESLSPINFMISDTRVWEYNRETDKWEVSYE